MLAKKLKENEEEMAEWMRKAERAVDKGEDGLARSALERYHSYQRLAQNYQEQVDDQKHQVDRLKSALQKLEQKLAEAKSKKELLLAWHRRSIASGKAHRAQVAIGANSKSAAFDRFKDRVHHTEAVSQAEMELVRDDVAEQLFHLDRQTEVDKLLADLKAKRSLSN